MYECFTDRAKKTMEFANEEAQLLNHEYIGTEHILLGLAREGTGVGANTLRNFDTFPEKIKAEILKIVRTGPHPPPDNLPLTPRAKKAIQFAIEESKNLNCNYVGTEHLLLGLLREEEGVAAQVLINLGLKLIDVRQEVCSLLGIVPTETICDLIAKHVADQPVVPELARQALEAFENLSARLQALKEQAVAMGDVDEANYLVWQQVKLKKMKVSFARKWCR